MDIKRYMPLAALGAWTAALAYLLMDQNYQIFLKPGFKGLILAGLGIAPALGLGLAASGLPRNNTSWLKGLILMLPIGFILMAGENTLGEYALRKRGLAPPAASQASPDPEITNQDRSGPISITDLIRGFTTYQGRPVQIEGLYAKTIADHDELSAVFRYFITCCAADAQPVGVFIDHDPDRSLKNNDWVRVSGRVEKKVLDGYEVIFMTVDDIQGTKKPHKNAAYIFN